MDPNGLDVSEWLRARLSIEVQKELQRQAIREEQQQTQTVLDQPIADFKLSKRARMAMDKLGVKSVGELTLRTADELLETKHFGMVCLNEVRDKLGHIGLKLRED